MRARLSKLVGDAETVGLEELENVGSSLRGHAEVQRYVRRRRLRSGVEVTNHVGLTRVLVARNERAHRGCLFKIVYSG